MLRPLVLAPVLLFAIVACGSSAPAHAPVVAAPGSGSAAAPRDGAGAVRTVPGTGMQAVTLSVGETLIVTRGTGETATPKDPTVLGVEGPALHALKVGTTTVPVERRPTCSPGMLCSQLVQLVGTVTVTVTG